MKMIHEKSWAQFRRTGLILFINSILHVFGWAIVLQFDRTGKKLIGAFPARCKFRGFDEKHQEQSYKQIARYMKRNASNLKKDTDL